VKKYIFLVALSLISSNAVLSMMNQGNDEQKGPNEQCVPTTSISGTCTPDSCALCNDPLDDKKTIYSGCSHKFHTDCLNQAGHIQFQNDCPICFSIIPTVNMAIVFIQESLNFIDLLTPQKDQPVDLTETLSQMRTMVGDAVQSIINQDIPGQQPINYFNNLANTVVTCINFLTKHCFISEAMFLRLQKIMSQLLPFKALDVAGEDLIRDELRRTCFLEAVQHRDSQRASVYLRSDIEIIIQKIYPNERDNTLNNDFLS